MDLGRTIKHIFSLLLTFICLNISAQGLKLVENLGQWHDHVEYRSEISGGYLFAEKNAFTYRFFDFNDQSQISKAHIGKGIFPEKLHYHAYKVNFIGSNKEPKLSPKSKQKEYLNYFIGNDESKWASHANVYGGVYYEDVYPKIDLDLYSEHDFVKYDLILHPGADVNHIRFQYEGIDDIVLKNGKLHIQTSVNQIIEEKPYAYQWVNGIQKEVICHYELNDKIVTFIVDDNYNSALPLVIDPVLKFSTFSGSTANNFGYTATYDRFGYLYSGSSVLQGSGDYPTTLGAFDTTFNGGSVDFAVTKYDSTGTFMVYSTLIGGNGSELPHSIVVNDFDELYIYGTTSSSNFPLTFDGYQTSFGGGNTINLGGLAVSYVGGTDIFITRLSAAGDNVLSSTLLGGSNNDGLNLSDATVFNYADEIRGEIDLDDDGNVYIATCTYSLNFPITANAFQLNYAGGQDGVICKLSPDLSELIWSTYYGGTENDGVYSLALTENDEIVVCGGTNSSNLSMTNTSMDDSYNGGQADAFAAKFSSDASSLISSTYLGTGGYDQSYFVELDGNNNVHLFGQSTSGADLIVNAGYNGGNSGQFISKLNDDMSDFIWSTTFGTGDGFPDISPTAFLVDLCSRIYLSGWGGPVQSSTSSTTGLPVTSDAYQSTTTGGDFYLFVIEEDASNLVYASFFGGSLSAEHVDGGTSRFDRKGKIYQSVCAGCQGNSDFPISPSNAVSSTNNSGGCNNGVFKFDFELPGIVADFAFEPVCLPDPVTFNNISEGGLTFSWDFGDDSTSEEYSPTHNYVEPGVYEVTLIINDPMSCNLADTITQEVVILTEEDFDLEDHAICNGEGVQLGFDPIPSPGYTYTWSPSNLVSNPSISNPTTNVSEDTEFTLTISNGVCESVSTQFVQVVNYEATFPEDAINCALDFVQTFAVEDYPETATFTWSTSPTYNDTINDDPFQNEINVGPNETTTYYVNMLYEGCEQEHAVNLFSEYFEIELPDQIEICENETETIVSTDPSPNPPVTFVWENNASITSSLTSSTISVLANENTTLFVTGTSLHGCLASDSVLLNVNFIDLQMPLDTIICDETEVALIANTFGTGEIFTWSDDPNFTNVLSNDSTVNVTPDVSSTYYFQTENFCEINGQVTVTLTSELYSISPDIFLCAGEDLTLNVNALIPDQNYTVNWSPDQFILSGDGTPTVQVLTSNSQYFYAEVLTEQGCVFSDSVLVEVSDLSNIVVEATADETVIPEGGSTVLHAVPAEDYDIIWTPNDPLSSGSSPDPTATLFNTTTFSLLVGETNANGSCYRGDSIIINVFEFACSAPTIFVPNAFSPNGDGFNDSLRVRSNYIDEMELFIYDRWGELVFQTKDINEGWDGMFKGALASPAVYVYYLDLTCINRQKGVVKGNITLLR